MTHERITCDGCKIDPITGTRWKCLVCDDYDLCDACHSSGAHPLEHAMLQIETPADAEDLREVVRFLFLLPPPPLFFLMSGHILNSLVEISRRR